VTVKLRPSEWALLVEATSAYRTQLVKENKELAAGTEKRGNSAKILILTDLEGAMRR
jgi:hypothetical protein